ncbi:MAG: cupin domain-containing protein [wastewater metagenome]|nr:cupin domain-containing protein [Candidatus Loosdrechtia aerotolerans]
MSNKKISFKIVCIPFVVSMIGCTTARYYPPNFVESLKHPTKFPEVYSTDVKNIEDVVDKNSLGEDEEVRITSISVNRNSSMHLIQVRENGELYPHYHKRHDEIIYVKKGSGVATLDGSRYLIKPGSVIQIPSRTVHKFLNTGDELFVAVSIFSPPFNGRDEKVIKEKRKPNRGAKKEKRLVQKESEKVEEKDSTSSTHGSAYESPEGENQVAEASSKKQTDKEPDTFIPEEKDMYQKGQSLQPTSSTPENKKQPEESIPFPDEEPTLNAKDMHEKLTKLFKLREEGILSEEEYEEKKDAVVKGIDIGELPETKGSFGKETWEDDDIFAPDETDEDGLSYGDISDTKEDTGEGVSELSGTDEVKEIESSEYMLKTLDEMMQEGVSTDEDYEDKKAEIPGIEEERVTSEQARYTTGDEKMKELKELYDEGLITGEDYESKRKELLRMHEERIVTIPSENSSDEKTRELKELYEEGLITREDYEYKLKELTDTQKPPFQESSLQKTIQNEKLLELDELREEGLISDEDYEFKKSQLLDR